LIDQNILEFDKKSRLKEKALMKAYENPKDYDIQEAEEKFKAYQTKYIIELQKKVGKKTKDIKMLKKEALALEQDKKMDSIERDKKKAMLDEKIVVEEKNLELLEETTEKKIDLVETKAKVRQAKKSGLKQGIPIEATKLADSVGLAKKTIEKAANSIQKWNKVTKKWESGVYNISEVRVAKQNERYHDSLRAIRAAQNREAQNLKIAMKLAKAADGQLDDDDLEEIEDVQKSGNAIAAEEAKVQLIREKARKKRLSKSAAEAGKEQSDEDKADAKKDKKDKSKLDDIDDDDDGKGKKGKKGKGSKGGKKKKKLSKKEKMKIKAAKRIEKSKGLVSDAKKAFEDAKKHMRAKVTFNIRAKKDLNKMIADSKPKGEVDAAKKDVKKASDEAKAAKKAFKSADKGLKSAHKNLTYTQEKNVKMARKGKVRAAKKKVKKLKKQYKSSVKKQGSLKKSLSEAKIKKDTGKITSITKKLEKVQDLIKSLGQQQLVGKMKLDKAMGKKFKPSKKKIKSQKKKLSKVSLRLTLFNVKETKLLDQKKDLLLKKKPLTKIQKALLVSYNKKLKKFRKEIPQKEDEVYAANEKYNILKGKEPTSKIIYELDKKFRKINRFIMIGSMRSIEMRKVWDKAEVDFTRNKTKPQKNALKGKMLRARKDFKMFKEKMEVQTKMLVGIAKQKKIAQGVKGEYKKKYKAYEFAMKKVKKAKRKEELAFKAWDREANSAKGKPELIKKLKENITAMKMALKIMKKKFKGVEKDYKKVQVTYFISHRQNQTTKDFDSKREKIAQKKKLAEFLTAKYLEEKMIVDMQKQVYDTIVFENKEAIKLGFKDKIEKTAKIMKRQKDKLDS